MEKILNRLGSAFIIALSAFFPLFSFAEVSQFVFTSPAQNIVEGAVSETITLQAQDASGASSNIPQTACLSFISSSSDGQFSSSATNWNPVTTLTMSKNTANRNFYYKDSASGSHTLTVKIALKPEGEERSCANWPFEEWSLEWTPTQNIVIGATSSGGNNSEQDQPAATSTQSANATQSPSGSVSSYVPPPEQQIFADAGFDRAVIVGADSIFSGRAYNRNKESISDHIRFLWNFGDGSTAEGASVLHRFPYPGRYAVVLTVTDSLETASDRTTITAESAKLSLRLLSDGGVSIENLGGEDIDLSSWVIRSGGAQFLLPKDSVILAGASLKISTQTLGFRSSSGTELDYPNGSRAFSAESPAPAPTTAPSVDAETAPSVTKPQKKSVPVPSKIDVKLEDPEIAEKKSAGASIAEDTPQEHVLSESQTAAAAGADDSYLWWLGVLGLALAGGGAIYVSHRAGKKEWNIIEERAEGE